MATNEVRAGDRFGRLVVQTVFSERGRRKATVRCDCGVMKAVRTDGLSAGVVLSCGCLGRERRREACMKHGECRRVGRSPLYRIWLAMNNRCRDSSRRYYGAVGVAVCEEWQVLDVFARWASANGYREGLTIDRIRSSEGYTPDNCRFVGRCEQNQHLRRCVGRSGYIGVDWSRGRWRARAQVYGQQKHLGCFDDPFSAAWVRDAYMRRCGDRLVTLNNLTCRRVRRERISKERRGTFAFSILGV